MAGGYASSGIRMYNQYGEKKSPFAADLGADH